MHGNFTIGFLSKCAESGIEADAATSLLKRAVDTTFKDREASVYQHPFVSDGRITKEQYDALPDKKEVHAFNGKKGYALENWLSDMRIPRRAWPSVAWANGWTFDGKTFHDPSLKGRAGGDGPILKGTGQVNSVSLPADGSKGWYVQTDSGDYVNRMDDPEVRGQALSSLVDGLRFIESGVNPEAGPYMETKDGVQRPVNWSYRPSNEEFGRIVRNGPMQVTEPWRKQFGVTNVYDMANVAGSVSNNMTRAFSNVLQNTPVGGVANVDRNAVDRLAGDYRGEGQKDLSRYKEALKYLFWLLENGTGDDEYTLPYIHPAKHGHAGIGNLLGGLANDYTNGVNTAYGISGVTE